MPLKRAALSSLPAETKSPVSRRAGGVTGKEIAQTALMKPLRSVHRVKPRDAHRTSTVVWGPSYVSPCLVSAMGSRIAWMAQMRVLTAESSEPTVLEWAVSTIVSPHPVGPHATVTTASSCRQTAKHAKILTSVLCMAPAASFAPTQMAPTHVAVLKAICCNQTTAHARPRMSQ